jgi:starch-binding outer membrane protein, SusD/RagB family
MNVLIMKIYRRSYLKNIKLLGILFLLFATVSCEIDDIPDPNNPIFDEENATKESLNYLVTGSVSGMRNGLGTYQDDVGVIGREYYRFSGSEPRFTSDLLGFDKAVLDNNTFYITTPWASRYRVVKNTNFIIQGATKSTAITNAEREGYLGFAKTIQAHQLLMNLNLTNENGIRVDVKDVDKLGPIVGKDVALTAIANLLNEANTHLTNAGTSFPFALSSGFAGFDTPTTFAQFNRALAARVAVYRKQYTEALTYLSNSFLTLNTNFNKGVYHVFGTRSGDELNPLFFAKNATGDVRIAHPDFVRDAATGDARLSKVSLRDASAGQSELSGTHDVAVYKSNVDPVAIIRNEELILIYAEAKIQTNQFPDALIALNLIRTTHGLSPYTGLVTKDALIDEMLRQRRYSLFGEGHRWIDMRRYDRLSQLPIDRKADASKNRQADDVWVNFPIPFTEGI